MNEDRAAAVANAWIEQDQTVDRENIERINRRRTIVDQTVASILPDTDDWAVLLYGDVTSIVAVADGALYRGAGARMGDNFALAFERLPLEESRVRVAEEISFEAGARWRRREWNVTFRDADPLVYETEERLSGDPGPPREERFLRAVAVAAGWPVEQ